MVLIFVFIQLKTNAVPLNSKERIYVHPIFWYGPSYYKKDHIEKIIKQVFVNCNQYNYMGKKEFSKFIDNHPEYGDCTRLYRIFEIAYYLKAEYLSVIYCDEKSDHINLNIKILDTDSLKIRYKKAAIIKNSDAALIDTIKTAFYNWNGEKYYPCSDDVERFEENLITGMNMLVYNVKQLIIEKNIGSKDREQPKHSFKIDKPVQTKAKRTEIFRPNMVKENDRKYFESESHDTRKYSYHYHNYYAYPIDSICIRLKIRKLFQYKSDDEYLPEPVDGFEKLENEILHSLTESGDFINFKKEFESGSYFQFEMLLRSSGTTSYVVPRQFRNLTITKNILSAIADTNFQSALIDGAAKNVWADIFIYVYY